MQLSGTRLQYPVKPIILEHFHVNDPSSSYKMHYNFDKRSLFCYAKSSILTFFAL